jgi:F-type H+-transporting ATPase subunit b
MHVDWWTLALEAINFLILVWLLQRFLYKPVIGIVARRRQEVDAAFAEVEDARHRTEAEEKTYQAKIAAVDRERLDIIRATRAQIEEERTKLIADARREADELLSKQRQAIVSERAEALADLRDGAADLAVSLATTLVREASTGSVAETFLERLRQRFLGLSEAERARLLGPATGPTVLRVVTAPALTDAQRRRWRERLGNSVGERWTIEFGADEDLVAGARIHFPAASLEISWAGALKDARKEFVGDESAA